MKKYQVSRTLDVEVDYFIVKTENLVFDALEAGDMETFEVINQRFQKLLELEEDMHMGNNGVFTVSSKNYSLAVDCREAYRLLH